jgi:aminoglycoside phosphotransferase (APT) family kinase protein
MIFDVEPGARALLAYMNPRRTPLWESRVLGVTAGTNMVVQYSFYHDDAHLAPEPLRLIGKFYADERGERTYRTMQDLTRTIAQSASPSLLAIPQALFYDPANRFIAQQRVDGASYTDLIQRRDYRQYLQMAGQALAILHTQDYPLGQPARLQDHLADLVHPAELCQQMPEYSARVEALIAAMEARERGWKEQIRPTPIHRDFHPRQLFYGQGRVWLTGWDLFAKGDPALDIGNFIVYLQTHLTHHREQAIHAFIEAYFADRPLLILERVPLYAALTYLRQAYHRLRIKETGWRDQVQDLLLHSEQCLSNQSIC